MNHGPVVRAHSQKLARVLIVALLSTGLANAQLGRRPAKDYIPLLENPARVERLKADDVVRHLGLRKGSVVADVGAGSGVFTRRLAEIVGPTGQVFAVDIDQELLDYNREKISEAGFKNVNFVHGDFDDPKLPRESFDLIFFCDVVHHIEQRQAYLGKLRPTLKAGGRVAIIDYRTNWPPSHEQMKFSVDELLGWMRVAGFNRVQEIELIPDAFFFIFVPSIDVTK